MEKKPYFICLGDYQKAKDEGLLPAGTVAFCGPSWVLVSFTEEQRKAYPYPIVEFCGQEIVSFNSVN